MPSTLYGENRVSGDGILKQVIVGITVAAVLGVWAFASTRASSADLAEVEAESKAADIEFKIEIKELSDDLHTFDVRQASFRAQVRQALSIPNDPNDTDGP